MKKIVKTIGLACLAGLFAVTVSSCKKTEDNTTKVVLTMEEIEDVYPGNERAYINMLDRGHTYWNRNDRIRAYNFDVTNDPNAYLNSTTAIYECGNGAEDQLYATFYGANLGSLQSDAYRFFYPVGMVNGVLGPYNTDTFTVAPVQNYTQKDWQGNPYATVDPLAMPLASKHESLNNFTMHHAFGYFRLWLTGEGVVDRVVLEDPNHHLTGYATLRLDKADMPRLRNLFNEFVDGDDTFAQNELVNYVYNPDELCLQTYPDGNTITLQCDDPIELNTLRATGFVFAVRPGALWWQPRTDGAFGDENDPSFKVTVYFDQVADYGHEPITITGEQLVNAVGGNPRTLIGSRLLTSRSGKCNSVPWSIYTTKE
jgi:hypothetical protein